MCFAPEARHFSISSKALKAIPVISTRMFGSMTMFRGAWLARGP
jgi:hypothetical protein